MERLSLNISRNIPEQSGLSPTSNSDMKEALAFVQNMFLEKRRNKCLFWRGGVDVNVVSATERMFLGLQALRKLGYHLYLVLCDLSQVRGVPAVQSVQSTDQVGTPRLALGLTES